jgi:hypothetical protein
LYSILLFYRQLLKTEMYLKGSFSAAKETEIRLMGCIGTKDSLLAQTKTDALGC